MKIGQMLVQSGTINTSQLAKALWYQKKLRDEEQLKLRLGTVISKMGLVDRNDIEAVMGYYYACQKRNWEPDFTIGLDIIRECSH